jgi:hypothetical protein
MALHEIHIDPKKVASNRSEENGERPSKVSHALRSPATRREASAVTTSSCCWGSRKGPVHGKAKGPPYRHVLGRRSAKVRALAPVQIVHGQQELPVRQDDKDWVRSWQAARPPLSRHNRGCIDHLGVPGIQRRLLHNGPVHALVTFRDGDAIVANVGPAGRVLYTVSQPTGEQKWRVSGGTDELYKGLLVPGHGPLQSRCQNRSQLTVPRMCCSAGA